MTDTDNLELKKRSRRRLVGAAALAVLAAVVLPMVMEQEPRRATQDIQIIIPDRDADSALSRPIGNRAEAPAEAELAPPPEEEPSDPVVVPKTMPPVQAPAQAAAENEQSSVAQPKAEPKSRQTPAAKPTPAQDEAARVQALLGGGQPEAVKPAAPNEVLVVQVGAFSEPGTAAALTGELKAKGFAAYTEKAGAVTRVRVGPFASRGDAEKAAERLRAAGRKAVVTPR